MPNGPNCIMKKPECREDLNSQSIGKCEQCSAILTDDDSYEFDGKSYCEDCVLTLGMPGIRKTHWQYLKSIKTEYLIKPSE